MAKLCEPVSFEPSKYLFGSEETFIIINVDNIVQHNYYLETVTYMSLWPLHRVLFLIFTLDGILYIGKLLNA